MLLQHHSGWVVGLLWMGGACQCAGSGSNGVSSAGGETSAIGTTAASTSADGTMSTDTASTAGSTAVSSCEAGTGECPCGTVGCPCTKGGSCSDGGATCIPSGTCALEMDGMVFVPEGPFRMGCDPDLEAPCNEGGWRDVPQHEVWLSAFWIDRLETTVAEYKACVQAGGCPAVEDGNTNNKPEMPIRYTNWFAAEAYCAWKGKRLPTEAQWEKAARGTDGRKYPWGNEEPTCELARYGKDVDGGECPTEDVTTAPPGSFPLGASPYGALDMAGNVGEWVQDYLWDEAYDRMDGTMDPVMSEPDTDHSGAVVWRGADYGAYVFGARGYHLRTSMRTGQQPGVLEAYASGIRCARTAQ